MKMKFNAVHGVIVLVAITLILAVIIFYVIGRIK
jgi:hypothetical protein